MNRRNMKYLLNVKNVIFGLMTLLLFKQTNLMAQTPASGIFFQAIARDQFTNPAKDRKIYVQSSIVQSSATGTKVLIEEHQTTTDGSGVFSISVGQGTRTGGTVANLDKVEWAKGPYYLNLKIAITPIAPIANWDYSKDWIDLGTSPFGTVPYALYSGSSGALDSKLNIADTVKMLSIYAKSVNVNDIANQVKSKLSVQDTTTMLAPYKRMVNELIASNITSLTAETINTALDSKVNVADSGVVYVTPLQLKGVTFDTTSLITKINKKVSLADSTTVFVTPLQLAAKTFDSTAIYTQLDTKLNKADTASLSSRINLKANIADVTTGLALKLNKADTASLSNRINLKANTTDLTSGLALKFNISDTNLLLKKVDTATLSNRINLKANTTDLTSGLALKINAAEKAVANGVATLDNNSKVPANQIPVVSFQSANVVASQAAMLGLSSAVVGSIAIRTDINRNYVLSGSNPAVLANWVELAVPTSVTTINGIPGAYVTLTTDEIGEGTTNKYYTDARVRNAISATAPLTYNASTGTFSITAASGSSNGYLTSTNFNTFNNKQNALTAGVDYATPSGNITGNAANVTGVVSIVNGGTGTTTSTGALINLGAEASANKSTATDLGNTSPSDLLYPSQKAVKTYVDLQSANAGVADLSITNAKLAGSITADKLLGSIPNNKLTNSALTIGTTNIALGATSTSLAGLSTVTATNLVGALTGNVTGDLAGNASTATKLATTKNINGVPFDGSTNITIAADANTLTGTTLANNVVNSSLTSVGTITSGVWNGTAIANNKLANSTTTLGSTTMTLGGTVTSVTGLTSVTSTGFTGALTGNASTATALATGRTISLTGDVTYTSPVFDGSGNVTAAATLAASGVASGTYGSSTAIPVLTVDTKGRVTSASTVGIIAGVNTLNYTSTTAYAAGGTISGTTLTLAAANGTNPGLISTGAQTIAGAKTFNNDVTAPNFIGNITGNVTGNLSGNATTATTAGNITATSNTTLTSLANLATVGTITSGVWSGTEVAIAKGGTGATNATDARTNLGLGSLATKSTIANADVASGAAIDFSKLNITKANITGLGIQEGLTAGSGISISSGTISATGLTTSNLASNAAITNAQLVNSTTILGSTTMTLGGTVTSVTGLTSLAATNLTGALTGNASTATALATGRTISLTGDVTYTSPVFDGSGNVTAASTLAASGVASGTYGSSTAIPVLTVDTKGRVTSASTVGIIAGVNTLTYTTGSSYANGGTVSGTTLTLAAADGTNPGLISTGTQTIAGAKTFSSNVTASTFVGNLSGTATTATNIDGGVAGSIPYQTAAGTTAMIPVGSANQFLTSTGSGTYTWTSTSAVTGNYVPYTGASGAVNLGAYDLTVNGLTVGKGGGAVASNTAIGISALASTVSSTFNNTAIGNSALANSTTANHNSVLGYNVLKLNTTSSYNTAIGSSSLAAYTALDALGGRNVALGAFTGQNMTAGWRNVILGYNAGVTYGPSATNLTSMDESILIGYNTKPLANATANEIVIGTQAIGNGYNTVTIGNSSITANYFKGSINLTGNVNGGTWSGTVIGNNYGGAGTSNGILKANGSGVVSAAVAGTDYQTPLTAGSGISISSGTISATGLTTSNLASNAAITNAQLANSTTTLGSTTMTLGGTVTNVTGLTSVTSTGFTGALTGNASTATKLAATKNINGVAFDGSADITVTADAGTLSGTTLKSTVTGSSLTSVGTITSGTWSASTIDVAHGGTGATTLTGILKGNGTGAFTAAVAGTDFQAPLTAGSGISIASGTISATGLTTSNLASNAAITNAQLANSTTILGSTTMTLGGTVTSVTGLTSVTSTGFTGALTGNASTATALATGRTISLTGDVTYTSPVFDGSGNVTAAATLAASGVASGTYGSSTAIPVLTVDTKGRVTSANTVSIVAGVNTMTAIAGTANANGATISGTALTLTPADATNGGVLTAGTQTIGGAKTFSNTATFNSDIVVDGINIGRGPNSNNSTNTAIGTAALNGASVLSNNVAVGYQSLYASSNAAAYNTAVGSLAGYTNSTGDYNSYYGYKSGYNNSTGLRNTAIGALSLSNGAVTGYSNQAIGYSSLFRNTGGYGNSALGDSAMYNNTTGYYNVGIGHKAMKDVTTGDNNVGIGFLTLGTITTGVKNIGIGGAALVNVGTGSYNIGIGYDALGFVGNLGGSYNNNIALGYQAGKWYNTGASTNVANSIANNIFIGHDVRPSGASDVNEIVIGNSPSALGTGSDGQIGLGSHSTLIGNSLTQKAQIYGVLTTVPSASTSGAGNSSIIEAQASSSAASSGGSVTLKGGNNSSSGAGGNINLTPGTSSTGTAGKVIASTDMMVNGMTVGLGGTGAGLASDASGNSTNVAVGTSALKANTGTFNTAIGADALRSNTSGIANIAIGQGAFRSLNNSGSQDRNTAIGTGAFYNMSTGQYNIGMGEAALFNITSGSDNVALGRRAGFQSSTTSSVTSANQSILIGSGASPLGTTTTNEIVMGYNANGNGSNTVTIGNTANTANYLRGTINTNTGTSTATQAVNVTGSVNDFLEFNIQNNSTGTSAQSGYNAMANNGNDALNFAWMGINNSNFNNPQTYNIGIANDVSFLGAGNDMYVANSSNKGSIVFSTGKAATPYFDERMRITNAGTVAIGTTGATSVDTTNAKLHIAGKVKIVDGAQAAGKVLTSDANGLAGWTYAVGSTVVTSTSAYAITLAEAYVFYTGTSAGAFTIPAAAAGNAGKAITIKNKSAYSITITPATGSIFIDNANGSAANVSIGIEASNNWIKLVSDGSQWNVMRALF